MILPENPIVRAFAVFFAFLLGIGAVGCLLVLLLLMAVSLEDPHRREMVAVAADGEPATRYQTADFYLRNRTTVPLQVRVVAARTAVRFDSIWWSLPQSPDAIGRAVLLRDSFAVGGLRYRAGHTLVLGTVDTLIDVHYPGPLPRALAHCRRIDIRYSPALATKQFKNTAPAYEHVLRVQRLPTRPDSLLLTLYLAPGDVLPLGHYRVLDEAAAPPASALFAPEVLAAATPPNIEVQWQDAQGHRHRHRPRLAGWPATPAAPPTGPQQVQHYLDYPLRYTTIIEQ